MKPIISYRTGDPATIQIIDAYWSTVADGKWEFTTASLRDRFGLKPPALARLVQESGSLFDLSRRCIAQHCNNPFEFTSRTAITDRDRSFGDFTGLCQQCILKRLEEQKREDEKKRQKAREFA